MDIREWQRDAAVHRYGTGYWEPFVIYARLGEESGEISRELNHLHGPKKRKPEEKEGSLSEEIGDAIFTLTCLANSHSIDLVESLRLAIAKCDGRDRNRFKVDPSMERSACKCSPVAPEKCAICGLFSCMDSLLTRYDVHVFDAMSVCRACGRDFRESGK